LTRFRIQYRTIDVNLNEGEFFVGRGSDCDLVLDDSMVSRRHAVFHVKGATVEVEDLASRNGVFVNGTRIAGCVALKSGDRTRIGSQELLLKDILGERPRRTLPERSAAPTLEMRLCPECSRPVEPGAATCSFCGAEAGHAAGKREPQALRIDTLASSADGKPGGSALDILRELVDKTFDMGRHEEAERILSGPLNAILTRAEQGAPIDPEQLAITCQYALRLARHTSKPKWLDFVFRLYTRVGRFMSAEMIDTLYGLTNSLKYSNPGPLREYISTLQDTIKELSPNQKFLIKRLEGMQQRVLSK